MERLAKHRRDRGVVEIAALARDLLDQAALEATASAADAEPPSDLPIVVRAATTRVEPTVPARSARIARRSTHHWIHPRKSGARIHPLFSQSSRLWPALTP